MKTICLCLGFAIGIFFMWAIILFTNPVNAMLMMYLFGGVAGGAILASGLIYAFMSHCIDSLYGLDARYRKHYHQKDTPTLDEEDFDITNDSDWWKDDEKRRKYKGDN